jgi:hypothetical protein
VAFEIASQVLHQGIHGSVALRRLGSQALGDDGIQVTTQHSTQARNRGGAGARDGFRDRDGAQVPWLNLVERAFDRKSRRTPTSLDIAGQEVEKYRA